jgi:prephenate dehydratase
MDGFECNLKLFILKLFETLTHGRFIQISRETMHPITFNNIHKNVRDNCSLTYIYSEPYTLTKFSCFVISYYSFFMYIIRR